MVCRLVLLLVLVSGCDADDALKSFGLSHGRYELKQDTDGRLLRLDKNTGETAILVGDKLIPVETPEQRTAKEAAVAPLVRPINWGSLDLKSLHTAAAVTTNWRDGRAFYQFSLAPASDILKATLDASRNHLVRATMRMAGLTLEAPPRSPRFVVVFLDADGFKTLEIPVPVGNLVAERDVDAPQDIAKYAVTDSVTCSAPDYQRAATWTVQWYDFSSPYTAPKKR